MTVGRPARHRRPGPGKVCGARPPDRTPPAFDTAPSLSALVGPPQVPDVIREAALQGEAEEAAAAAAPVAFHKRKSKGSFRKKG